MTKRSCSLLVALLATLPFPLFPQATASGNFVGEDSPIFEFVGQVKNSPPNVSIQYGYLTSVTGVDDIFAPGTPSEKTAKFTFYNESVTLRTITNGSLLVINRQGTTTIYYDATPSGDRDLSAPATVSNLNKFRVGIPVQTSTWKHQVIFDRVPVGTRTDLFFVNFWNTITSADAFDVDGNDVRLGKIGDRFRMSLVGGPDTTGNVNGKFAGVAVSIGSKSKDR